MYLRVRQFHVKQFNNGNKFADVLNWSLTTGTISSNHFKAHLADYFRSQNMLETFTNRNSVFLCLDQGSSQVDFS